MAEEKQNGHIYGGDDVTLELTLFGRDGAPLDLTGSTLRWGMAPARVGDAVLTKTSADAAEIEITDAAGGLAVVKILSADTVDLPEVVYNHALKIVDPAGKIETLLVGQLTIRGSILGSIVS